MTVPDEKTKWGLFIATFGIVLTLTLAVVAWGFGIGSRLTAAEVVQINHEENIRLHVSQDMSNQLLRIEKSITELTTEMRGVRDELKELGEE